MFSKSKTFALLLLVAVAATGFFSGHAAARYGARDCGRRARFSFSGMLQDSLGLTDTERDTVQAIVVRHRAEMQAIMETVRPRMDSVRAVVNDDIAAVLPAAKRERFEALRAQWRAERARRDSLHRADSTGGRR